jgi:hypothetical protein
MNLTLENFKGVVSGTVSIPTQEDCHVTLIAGPIGSGKTSTIEALQACALGEVMPVELKKKDAKLLVNLKAKNAKAVLTGERGTVEIKWPSLKLTATNPAGESLQKSPFRISKYAAGLAKPVDIPTKDLTSLLGILPSREEFDLEMTAAYEDLPVEEVWKCTQTEGWDAAFKKSEENHKRYKREWSALTGQEYGPDKHRQYVPEHYISSPLEELNLALDTANKFYAHALKAEALDEKAKADLETLAATYDSQCQLLEQAKTDLSTKEAELTAARKLLTEIPKILNQSKAYECWHCKSRGVLSGDKLIEAPAAMSDEEATAIRQRTAEQEENIRVAQAARDQANSKIAVIQVALKQAQEAKTKLGQVDLNAEAPAMSSAQALAEIQQCKARIRAYEIKQELEELHMAISATDFMCAVLCPEGLRKNVLSTKLGEFNELLQMICELANWPVIYLDEDLLVRMKVAGKDLPYVLLSRGQKHVCNVVLQVALMKTEGSEMLILDNVDKLNDGQFLPGLASLIENIPYPVILGLSTSKEQLFDLNGKGRTYWCENETISAL